MDKLYVWGKRINTLNKVLLIVLAYAILFAGIILFLQYVALTLPDAFTTGG